MSSKEKALSLSDKARQYSFQNRFEEFLANENGQSRPCVVELDPTTACNLACHGCISASLLNQGGFKRERIKELAKEYLGKNSGDYKSGKVWGKKEVEAAIKYAMENC